MIYILQLEPMKERYTYWWEDYIPQRITRTGKSCQSITGTPLTDKVLTGTVLDAAGTNHYKATQLQKVCEMFFKGKVKPHDHFLVADIWYPGIEMLRYMSQMYQIPIHVWGVWHAGSSTTNDFAEPMHNWSKYFEVGFLNMCDGIFVGSEYSKQSIIERLLYDVDSETVRSIATRISAYGMPLNLSDLRVYHTEEKENIILFPHRPDEEKNPHTYINIINGLSMFWDKFDDYKFVFCTSKDKYQSQSTWINASLAHLKSSHSNIEIKENLYKEEYYKLLSKSKLMISTTSEENFGYCGVEALSLGCNVLLPNAFSHPEIVEEDRRLLYNNYDDLMAKIPFTLESPVHEKELLEYVKPYDSVVEKWIELMKV